MCYVLLLLLCFFPVKQLELPASPHHSSPLPHSIPSEQYAPLHSMSPYVPPMSLCVCTCLSSGPLGTLAGFPRQIALVPAPSAPSTPSVGSGLLGTRLELSPSTLILSSPST
ncbi:hypothetical protein B484DRAFT_266756 [Ochromonadaceae sp. CCMP2298]|nr:hypothetical protein B484DRAFT_266756 [Ochromonadaceae sp. CCMP2298]